MADTVRCPYCALGFEFRPMVAHLDGRYICDRCGHTARPDDRKYQCRCPRCVDLAILRQAASRASGLQDFNKLERGPVAVWAASFCSYGNSFAA